MTAPTPELRDAAEALRRAAVQFREYARQHRAKDPPQDLKAAVNDDMAEMCEAALASNPAPSGGGWEEKFDEWFVMWSPAESEAYEAIEYLKLAYCAGYLAALSPVQPAGWRLVPETPTDHQVMSARFPYEDLCLKSQMESVNWKDAFRVIYCAMISAAPAASTSTTEG